MTRQELERFSEDFASGIAVVELALGRSIWRSCGCLLVGLDEEDLVRGRSEEFNEWGSVREWIFVWSLSGRRNEEIEGDIEGVFKHQDVFSRYMLFMIRGLVFKRVWNLF